MSIPRLLFLAAFFGFLVWYFVLPSLDDPVVREAVHDDPGPGSEETEAHRPWTQEDRALWRERVNQRLR